MKHAFLIIAHNNFNQLKKLVEILDDKDFDIFIHIDKKAKDFLFEEFANLTNQSKLEVSQEFSVFWGGYSQVQTELYLLEKAHNKYHYDYYHVISGADLPLKSNEQIKKYFSDNKGFEFIVYDDNALTNNPEISRRTRLYHPLQNYRRRYKQKLFNSFLTFLERCDLVIQILFGVNRTKNLDWTIKYGSNWVSITNSLVEEILKYKEKIYRVFHCTNCADELFIQTIAFNCGFKDKIYIPKLNESANLRFVDWSRENNGNPYTFTIEDKELLLNRNELFARKFSEEKDKEIIDYIYSKIKS